MIYTDKIHLVADSLDELHAFAIMIGLKRHYFEGVRKKHPHYDIWGEMLTRAIHNDAKIISSKELLLISKQMK